ncbi:MAG: hypothetical protein WC406_11190 [Methanoregula sp.]
MFKARECETLFVQGAGIMSIDSKTTGEGINRLFVPTQRDKGEPFLVERIGSLRLACQCSIKRSNRWFKFFQVASAIPFA